MQVGAPPEVVARLEQACAVAGGSCRATARGDDPALDQFMEAYCEMLSKYEQELSKPFKEAMLFFSRIESQLKALAVSSSTSDGLLTLYSSFFFSFVHFPLILPLDYGFNLVGVGSGFCSSDVSFFSCFNYTSNQ